MLIDTIWTEGASIFHEFIVKVLKCDNIEQPTKNLTKPEWLMNENARKMSEMWREKWNAK